MNEQDLKVLGYLKHAREGICMNQIIIHFRDYDVDTCVDSLVSQGYVRQYLFSKEIDARELSEDIRHEIILYRITSSGLAFLKTCKKENAPSVKLTV